MKTKKVKVVKLKTTKTEKNIGEFIITETLYALKSKRLECGIMKQIPTTETEFYDLYFISDDEIKDNDWFMPAFCSYPIHNTKDWRDRQTQLGVENVENFSDLKMHKIIASTDTSLNLPKPPQSFVKKYCEQDGIDEVMVEYIPHLYRLGSETPSTWNIYADENNEISILSIKNSWSRDEVIKIIYKVLQAIDNEIELVWRRTYAEYNGTDLNNWIKNNL